MVAVFYFSSAAVASQKDPGAYGAYGYKQSFHANGKVYYPKTLPSGSLPLVVLVHGLYESRGTGAHGLPLPGVNPSRDNVLVGDSNTGYAYLAQRLASHGYVVTSLNVAKFELQHNSNSMSRFILEELKKWRSLNRSGTLADGTSLVGKINTNNIGLFGHSRGGAGIHNAFFDNRSSDQPFGIKALFSIAPTISKSHSLVSEDVALATLLPYEDGDVTTFIGANKFEQHRYSSYSDAVYGKHTIVAMNADHNGYNTVWLRPDRIPLLNSISTLRSRQRADAISYFNAFFRVYLGNEKDLLPYLTGEIPVSENEAHISYQPPASSRKVINSLNDGWNQTVNTLTGAVSSSSLTVQTCGEVARCLKPSSIEYDPYFSGNHLNLRWSRKGAWFINAVPAKDRDFRKFKSLQFRAGSLRGNSSPQDFDLQLIDTTGRSATVPVSSVSDALFSPTGATKGVIPRVVLSSVNIPLSKFSGVNLASIASIKMVFNKANSGEIRLADLMLVSSPPNIDIPEPEQVPGQTSEPEPEPVREWVCHEYVGGAKICYWRNR